jgi:hypothetical protein
MRASDSFDCSDARADTNRKKPGLTTELHLALHNTCSVILLNSVPSQGGVLKGPKYGVVLVEEIERGNIFDSHKSNTCSLPPPTLPTQPPPPQLPPPPCKMYGVVCLSPNFCGNRYAEVNFYFRIARLIEVLEMGDHTNEYTEIQFVPQRQNCLYSL